MSTGLILHDSSESLIHKYLSIFKWDTLVARYAHNCCLKYISKADNKLESDFYFSEKHENIAVGLQELHVTIM